MYLLHYHNSWSLDRKTTEHGLPQCLTDGGGGHSLSSSSLQTLISQQSISLSRSYLIPTIAHHFLILRTRSGELKRLHAEESLGWFSMKVSHEMGVSAMSNLLLPSCLGGCPS